MPVPKIKWNESLGAAGNARARLPELAAAFFASGRKAALVSAPVSALHRFRLEVKSFRYTLESFQPFYGPGLERRIAGLRRMQDYLGALNDCVVTLDLVAARLPSGDPERRMLDVRLSARARRMAASFRRYWAKTFDRPGEERLWIQYLKRPLAGPAKRP